MQIISDIFSFLRTLSFVDIVFFFAVVALMLLVITLIHFVLENKEAEEEVVESKKEEVKASPIEIKTVSEKKAEDDKIMKEANELLEIAAALEQAEPNNSNLNHYEEEQEEKAIISYEELLERTNEWAINYSEEENIDEDLTIKKVDLNNLVNKDIVMKPEIKVSVISYEKEEAFLAALKELQHLLN